MCDSEWFCPGRFVFADDIGDDQALEDYLPHLLAIVSCTENDWLLPKGQPGRLCRSSSDCRQSIHTLFLICSILLALYLVVLFQEGRKGKHGVFVSLL